MTGRQAAVHAVWEMRNVPQPCGTWSQAEIAGHPCDLYEPPTPSAHGYTVMYLHGVHLQTLHDKHEFIEQFDRFGLRVVCPRTGPCWWTDKICSQFDGRFSPEQYILGHVLPFVSERLGAATPRIALLGTSMGGQGALRLAFKRPNMFPVVAAISPAIDYHLRLAEGDQVLAGMYPNAESARQDTATLHVHPLNWPRNLWFCCDPADYRWHESTERLRMKLSALGIPHECDLQTEGGGHGFGYYCQMAPAAVGFLAERLERERLRVL